MATTIQNMTNRKVIVRLSSGVNLHIAPKSASAELNDVEVQNAKIRKLEERRVISLKTSGSARSSSRSSSSRSRSESSGAAEAD